MNITIVMPAKEIKDYYRILGVAPAANIQDVKKAYRALVFKYHPDTSDKGDFAKERFHDVQEAYEILSDAQRRRRYDEERWLSGMSRRAEEQVAITPAWILAEAQRLGRHMMVVDAYRMDHAALRDYVFLLLSKAHIAVLQQEGDEHINRQVIQQLLAAVRSIKFSYLEQIAVLLQTVAGADADLVADIQYRVDERRRQAAWERFMPLVAIGIALLLTAIMFFWGRR